ncbi:clathrin interactor 1 [Echinococcus multilocularis]|uniref:Clathrin interactor 1 n=1 Tax=Echinococcus multilocularis TaxID=6211 RepID=A0A087VYV0_ECHMU|nr:clathrin interactor 1 [Echinococcus multilocularis]
MFREYLEKGKVWVDKITSAVMNYTELENKVREATNDEPWGPHGKILNDLARETHDTEGLLEIMTMLLSRIFPENSTNWRRIYKGLVVLAHLLRNGSERVCDIALDNIYNLRSLENYQCVDERGRDQGSSVRIKAHEVVELLQDAEFLQAERQKALTSRKDYAGIGNSHAMGSNCSGDYGMFDDGNSAGDWNYSDSHRYPSLSAPQAEMPWREKKGSNERRTRFSSSRLGSFDSWKLAHERTIVDDVADKFSDMLKAAKVVTNDLLGKPRVPPPSVYEEDPHKVSEEVFSFPGATVDQPEEEEYNSYRRTSATSKLSPTTQTSQKSLPTATPAALVDFDLPPTGSIVTPPTRLPRPPSTEMLASPPRNRQNDDNTDFFAELDKHQAKMPQNAATTATDLFANFTAVNPPVAAQTTPTAGAPVDADFGDFSSFKAAPVSKAPAKTVTITTTSSQSTKQSADPLFDEFTSPPLPSTFAHTAMTTALTPSTVPLQPQKPSSTVVNSTPEQQMSDGVPSAPSNVGKTWSGLGAFNLDIDFKIAAASPTKPAAPSLSQLQSLKQKKLVTQPVLPQTNSCGAAFGATSPGSSKMDDFSNFAVFK